MKNKDFIINVIKIFLPIILTIFIWHDFNISGNNVIFVLIYIGLYFAVDKTLKNADASKTKNICIISIFYTIATFIGKSISNDHTLNHIFDKWFLINFLGFFSEAYILINCIYCLFEKKNPAVNSILEKKKLFANKKTKYSIIFLLIILCWIPYLLSYYPGIITPDPGWQISQVMGVCELSNHHPILHTGIIAIAVNLGLIVFGNLEAGICIYSIISMCVMSTIFTFILYYLEKKNVPLIVRLIVLLNYMFNPVHAYYSITMWKDIFFSGMFGILFILLIELITNTEAFLSKKRNILMFIIVALLVIFLRNNGLYCIALSMPFIIIFRKKYWKVLILMFTIILIAYLLINTIIYNFLGVVRVASGEALSIPMQQIARVDKYHRDELDEATKQEIYNYFYYDNIGDYYNPELSDNVKYYFKSDYFDENKGEFIGLWIRLFFKYPKDYFESFFSNSYGYYYTEAQNYIFSYFSNEYNLDVMQKPLIEGSILNNIISISQYSTIPIYSMAFSVGFTFWLMIACLGYKILNKEKEYIIVYLPLLVLWLTMLASPVFCEFRYAYSLFTCLPIFISINLIKREN